MVPYQPDCGWEKTVANPIEPRADQNIDQYINGMSQWKCERWISIGHRINSGLWWCSEVSERVLIWKCTWIFTVGFFMWTFLLSRQSDVEIISEFILNQVVPLQVQVIKIAYKLFNLVGFQSDLRSIKLLKLCFGTLVHIHDTSDLRPAPVPNESVHHVMLLMRICSNIAVLNKEFSGFIIYAWFKSQDRSMASFFNHFIELLTTNGFSAKEIFWFIGNLLKDQTSDDSTIKYLENDDFFKKLHTNHSNWK